MKAASMEEELRSSPLWTILHELKALALDGLAKYEKEAQRRIIPTVCSSCGCFGTFWLVVGCKGLAAPRVPWLPMVQRTEIHFREVQNRIF